MISKFGSWSLNQQLAMLAGLLGLLALVAGSPIRDQKVTIDLKELARAIESEDDHVNADQLADWIMLKSQVRVIDLRDSASFASHHIPTAELLSMEQLLEERYLEGEMLVLYSEGGIHAAQAWMLMKAKGHTNVYTLKGGLFAWSDDILAPVLSSNPSPEERVLFAKRKALSEYFGMGIPAVARDSTDTIPKSRPTPPVRSEREREKTRDGC
jgi:rhodanese-related sulfurtransferase